MNASMLPPTLLSLLVLASPLAAQVRHSVDEDVYQQVAALVPETQDLVDFDADWTADGQLALAYVERGYVATKKYWQDRLVIALRDPQSGSARVLATFQGLSGWRFLHVSLAVPESFCAVPDPENPDGVGQPLHDGNRVYVAITAEAPSYKGASNGSFQWWVRAVRLFSVSFTDPQPKLALVSPPGLYDGLVESAAVLPHAEVSVGTLANPEPDSMPDSYVVELVFLDPASNAKAGQVMLSRSWNNGASLTEPFYVTGPCSAAAKGGDPEHPLVNSLFVHPVTFFDEVNGLTTLAIEDSGRGVVHVLQGKPESCEFEVAFTTPTGLDDEAEPRLAVREGEINFTCLVGREDAYGARDLEWYHGSFKSGFKPLHPLTDRALGPGDIELHHSDAYVVVRGLPDQGTQRARILSFVTSRYDPYEIPVEVALDDDDRELRLEPRSAVSPEHRAAGTPFHFAALWQVEGDPASGLPRSILSDE